MPTGSLLSSNDSARTPSAPSKPVSGAVGLLQALGFTAVQVSSEVVALKTPASVRPKPARA